LSSQSQRHPSAFSYRFGGSKYAQTALFTKYAGGCLSSSQCKKAIKNERKTIKKGMKRKTRLAHISIRHAVIVVLFFLY
jgi:hypothetical protein